MEENKVVVEYVVVADRIRRIYAWVSSVVIISVVLILLMMYEPLPCVGLGCLFLIAFFSMALVSGLIFLLGYILQKFLIHIAIDKKSKLSAIVSITIGVIVILSTGLLLLTWSVAIMME